MNGITIKFDDRDHHPRVYLDGQDISHAVKAVSWRHEDNHIPVATVEVRIVEAAHLDGRVEWVGLESVPFEALEAEIERRKSPTEG